MGQQQLLLIVLGVIIVGVAIIAGIGLFNAGSEEAVKDELVAQCLAIGANAQQWLKKPVAMGGGGGVFSTTNGALTAYQIPRKMAATSNAGRIDATTGEAVLGEEGYVITTPGDLTITITATPNDLVAYPFTVTCEIDALGMQTTVVPTP